MIYIASPYAHDARWVMQYRRYISSAVAAALIESGWPAYSPLAHGSGVEQFGPVAVPQPGRWLEHCLHMVRSSSHVVGLMLDGWPYSVGMREELKLANELRKPVVLAKQGSITDLLGQITPHIGERTIAKHPDYYG